MINALKHIATMIRNWLTFPKYQKPKLWRGVLKKWKILKLILEPKSQNMICCRHKNKTKSKRWALNLKNWASYGYFLELSRGEISISSNFQILKSRSNFKISTRFFFMWAQFWYRYNFYIATWGLKQLLHWFSRGGIGSPPPLMWVESNTPWLIGLSFRPNLNKIL